MTHRIQYSTSEVLNLLDESNDQDEPFMEGSDEEFEDWLTDEEDEPVPPPPTGNVTQHILGMGNILIIVIIVIKISCDNHIV